MCGEYLNWTAVPFWATWESESKAVKGNVSPSWEVALWRQGSRQKHIMEGRSSVNEGSMHHSPQLLTLPWVTAKTPYIVLTRFCTLEYEFSIFPRLRGTTKLVFLVSSQHARLEFFPTQSVLSETYQATLCSLFNHARHAALLHHGDLLDKRVWQPSFTRTEPTQRCLQVSFNTIITF